MSCTAVRLRRARGDRGASAAEYALLISLIAVIILGAVTFLGTNLKALYEDNCNKVAATQSATC